MNLCLRVLAIWSFPRITWVTPSMWSSTVTEKFIRGYTMASFRGWGGEFRMRNIGKSRIAGSGWARSVFTRTEAEPSKNSPVSIFSKSPMFSSTDRALQGHAVFFSFSSLNCSFSQVQTYAPPSAISCFPRS